jgi:hypothetical protein
MLVVSQIRVELRGMSWDKDFSHKARRRELTERIVDSRERGAETGVDRLSIQHLGSEMTMTSTEKKGTDQDPLSRGT